MGLWFVYDIFLNKEKHKRNKKQAGTSKWRNHLSKRSDKKESGNIKSKK